MIALGICTWLQITTPAKKDCYWICQFSPAEEMMAELGSCYLKAAYIIRRLSLLGFWWPLQHDEYKRQPLLALQVLQVQGAS